MKSENKPRYVTRLNSLVLVGVFLLTAAVLVVPFYSAQSSSPQPGIPSGEPSNASRSGSLTASNYKLGPSSERFRSLLAVPQSSPETIQTYAQNCSTPKTVFQLGETVCAKTDSVSPLDGSWWVNWIIFNPTATIVSGGDGVFPVTTNPQFFSYTPTAVGSYKVSLSNVPGDPSQTPAGFTVINQTASIATYAPGCTTPKSSFNLGETVCIQVQGLSNEEFPHRRVQLAGPDGFVLQSFDVTDNAQQFTYTIPSANTETFAGQTIDHRGNWIFALVDPDADLHQAIPVVVHKSNLFVDRVADLQLSKSLLGIPAPDPQTNVTLLTFQLYIYNQGPDPATNPRLTDVTLPNTTFVSFARNQVLALNAPPNTNSGSILADDAFLNSDLVRFLRDSGGAAFSNNKFPSASLMPFMQDSSLTFNCVPPSVGSAGTTTCTTTGELAPGETASFTVVYQIAGSVASGVDLTDNNSATVGSDTTDQFPAGNIQAATVTTSNPNPPTCTVTCPDNITVGTNTTDGQGHPGAIVAFDNAETAGSTCGTGVTATPASGTFFGVGTTPVTQQTGGGQTCSFTVTVINTPQPTITCAADQSGIAPSGQSETTVSVTAPSFTGSLATISGARSDQRDVSEPYPIGTTTIIWTVKDQYGTTRSCTQHIVVTSADAPTISCPSNKTFAAAAGDCQKTLTAADIGSPTTGGLNVTLSSSRSDGAGLTDAYPAGQTTITWAATNALGTASCTQVITITTTGDTTPPTLTVPPDLNVTVAAGACSALLDDELGVATATDNCTPAVNVSRSGVPMVACPIPGNPTRMCESFVFPVGTTNVTYTATDAAGNTATGVQHVTVHEPTPPVFTFVPADLVNVPTGPGATACGTFIGDATLGTATVSDNCDTTVIRTGVPAGNIFPVGSTTITYTARADISVTRTQTVTVVDNTVPVVTAPGPVTLYTGPNATSCGVTVSNLNTTLGTGSATDNCPGVGAVTRSGVPSGNVFPVGTTTVTYSATDAHGNTGSATQVVTVVDNTPPVITLNGQTPSMWPPNHKYQTFLVTNFVTGVTDNCGAIPVSSVVITQVTSDETENGNGDGNTSNDIVIAADCKSVQLRSERDGGGDGRVYTIHFKVVDSHGNVGTAIAKVVVQHNPGETPVDSGVHYTVNSSCQ